jgi:L-alanine-DL-glutamate epimerase-like enolase superfamily enzyme
VKITDIEAVAIRMSSVTGDVADGAHDDVVVQVHTDEGITGIGEVDAPPSVITAIIDAPTSMQWAQGFKDLLIGEDPLEPARLWNKVYEGNLYAGRRGLGINALGAIDIALYDIAGKALNLPVYQLLGGAAGRPDFQVQGGGSRRFAVPYASILPTGSTAAAFKADSVRRLEQAVAEGYRAAKIEILYGDRESDRSIIDVVEACVDVAGADFDLLLDVGYRWTDAKSAIPIFRALEEYPVYFVEAPIHPDNLNGYAELARSTTVRVAAGEMLCTRFEFLDLMDRGGVDVVQPNVGRVGGFTEALRVGRLAHDRGVLCIPHAWKSGISIAANLHLAAALPNTPYFEFMISFEDVSDVRRRLVYPEFELAAGVIPLPERPGLGVELDVDLMRAHALV